MKNTLKEAANTVGTAASGVGNTTANLASDVGNTTGNVASGLGNTTANVASGIGRTVTGGSSNLGSGIGSNLPSSSQTATGGHLYQSSGPGFSSFQSSSGPGVSNYQPSGPGYSSFQSSSGPGVSTYQSSGSGRTSGQYQQPVGSEFYAPLAPNVTREHIDKPTIVRETILPQEKIEIQPVIHREREQLEVHEVVQPMHERDIGPTLVKHATLPAQVRPEVKEVDTQFQSLYREASSRYSSESHVEPTSREFYNKPAIIEEHISKKIIEEVQPVLYKETVTPVLIEETQPIYERIIETPTIVEEMRQPLELGTKMQPLTGQMENLNLREAPATFPSSGLQQSTGLQQPTGFQKETFVTKEYFPAEDLSKMERAQVDTKRNV
jgi:hypothetical protein